jgi:hypothetical protein
MACALAKPAVQRSEPTVAPVGQYSSVALDLGQRQADDPRSDVETAVVCAMKHDGIRYRGIGRKSVMTFWL